LGKYSFYIGFGLQLFGFTTVGLCLYTGITSGDYSKVELAQFILGSFAFYIGSYFKSKA